MFRLSKETDRKWLTDEIQDGTFIEAAKRGKKLEKLSTDPGPELKNYAEDAIARYTERCRRFGVEPPEPPRIIYISREKMNAAEKIFGASGPEGTGFFYARGNIICILAGEDTPCLTTANILDHELNHAYAKVNLWAEIENNTTLNIDVYRTGCMCDSPNGKYGCALEEGRVVLDEFKNDNTIARERFSKDYAFKMQFLDMIVRQQLIKSDDIPYLRYANLYNVDAISNKASVWVSSYCYVANLVEFLEDELHNGQELIERSRVTGHLADLAGAFEKRFGLGSFRVFMTCGFSKEECEAMKAYLLETDPVRKEEMAKEILAARPHDMERHERRITVSKKINAGSYEVDGE